LVSVPTEAQGPFTAFVPTNSALMRFFASDVQDLFENFSPDMLTQRLGSGGGGGTNPSDIVTSVLSSQLLWQNVPARIKNLIRAHMLYMIINNMQLTSDNMTDSMFPRTLLSDRQFVELRRRRRGSRRWRWW